jgi:hypothetical protein
VFIVTIIGETTWKSAECLKKLQQTVCGRMQNVLKYQQVVCVKNAE